MIYATTGREAEQFLKATGESTDSFCKDLFEGSNGFAFDFQKFIFAFRDTIADYHVELHLVLLLIII